jgi:hypothetical protein
VEIHESVGPTGILTRPVRKDDQLRKESEEESQWVKGVGLSQAMGGSYLGHGGRQEVNGPFLGHQWANRMIMETG